MNRIHPASVARRVTGRISMITSRGAIAGFALAASALPALAQDELRLPRIEEPPTAPRIWMYAVTILLLVVIIFAASFKSKRTHQD